MNPSVAAIKRTFDVVGSLIGLSISAPIMVGVAIAIKFDDGGPIFYRQIRAGANSGEDGGELQVVPYKMYKFRSMRTDAEKPGKAAFASKNDPRVTGIGAFLRKTRLDEIPNLFNVLKGDMSIVGPRPERPEMITNLAAAIPFFEERMRNVKPGVTGLAQINLDYLGHLGKDHDMAHLREFLVNPFGLDYDEEETVTADDMRTKIIFDFAYAASLERLSSFLLTDLEVILKTPMVMLGAKGR